MKIPTVLIVCSTMVVLGLIGAITFLVYVGKDYQGILILLSTITLLGGQAWTLVKSHGVEAKVDTVQSTVNGQMSGLINLAAGKNPSPPA